MIEKEKVRIRSKNLQTIVRRAIINEGPCRSRILYAGINPSNNNTMVVHKIVELFKGKYFFEETVFNPIVKSVHTTLTSIAREKFHTIVDPKEKLHDLEFHPNPQIIAATSYSRDLENGKSFNNILIKDCRPKSSFVFDFYIRWRINRYLKKKF